MELVEPSAESFETRCPKQYQMLFEALEALMEGEGYLPYKQGKHTGSTRSSTGNFFLYREHGTEKKFLVYWYDASTNVLKQKTLKKQRSVDSLYYKLREELHLK